MADAMDSKSISREGVGVQVPASAPPHSDAQFPGVEIPRRDARELAQRALHGLAHDAFARAALPVLMHRINNATQVLAGLNALLALRGTEPLADARSADLAGIATTYAESGWLLAVLGSALGAESLLERRENTGLAATIGLVTELARRNGRVLECCGTPPELNAGHGAGWEAAWAVGSWLHAALLATPSGACLRVRIERDGAGVRFVDDAPWDETRAEVATRISSRVPGLSAERSELRLAAAWCA